MALEFHPLVDVLATMGSSNTIQLWDFRQRRIIKEIRPEQKLLGAVKRSAPPCLRFSPDGKWLCYTSLLHHRVEEDPEESNMLRIFDLSQGVEIFAVEHPLTEEAIVDLAFHPLHMILVTINLAGTLRVWDMTSFRLLQCLERANVASVRTPSKISFTSDGEDLLLFQCNCLEKFQWDKQAFQLLLSGTISVPSDRTPSHVMLSGSSMLSLVCGSSNSFSLWLFDTTFQVAPLQVAETPNLTEKSIPDLNERSAQAEPLIGLPSPVAVVLSKPVQALSQRIVQDRKNAESALPLTDLCASLLGTGIQALTEASVISDLSGEKHKAFLAAMSKRQRLLKPLEGKKSNINGILSLFAAVSIKDIDTAMLSVAIDCCLDHLDDFAATGEDLATFNKLLPLLLGTGFTL